ncbi:MAG: hypothetical protein GYA53_09675, partial [Acidobacteria bacterium]|nr:hypothetical protein [Acidobacteriota bacterium]
MAFILWAKIAKRNRKERPILRINKFLAQAGLASRREADRLVEEGRVQVNHRLVRRPGTMINEISDRVEVDGRPVSLPTAKVYILLNKPPGYIVTM